MEKHLISVNLFVYSVGTSVCIYFAWPLFRAIRGSVADCDAYRAAAVRCFVLPAIVGGVALFLWLSTAVAFPVLASDKSVSGLPQLAIGEFFVSQLTHGLIASSLTYLTMALATLHLVLPENTRSGSALQATTTTGEHGPQR